MRHFFRIIPILTTIAVSLRFALSSLPVVEVYFGWGGIGDMLLRSLFNQDTDLTIALLLALGVIFILVTMLMEVSYYAIDPRLRGGPSSINREDRGNVWTTIQSIVGGLGHYLKDNPISRWVHERISPQEPEISPFQSLLDADDDMDAEATSVGDNSRWRFRRKA